jgi:hypothetical protein
VTKLFGRAATLNVHGKLLQGLDFEFRVDRNVKAESNTADFTIYNLNPDNRKFLQSQKGGVIVELRAGYADTALPLIFLGQLREVTTLRDGSDWTTQLSTGDGDKARKTPVAFSLGPGASFDAAVKKSLSSMGLHAANVTKDIAGGHFGDASKELVEGFAAFGFGGPELDKLVDSAGFEGSIQNGEYQMLPKGAVLNKPVVTLDETSGLVGSPELGIDKNLPQLKFRSLLNADIAPARLVHVIAVNLNGFFRVERAAYSGQTTGGDWYVDCEARPVKTVTK